MNKNELASFQTRSKILEIARKKFISKGFHNTSLQEIVNEIGLTRGAFYHHFKNKEEIHFELMKTIQNELGDHVANKSMQSTELWEQLILGCVAFIEKAIDKDVMQILLIDGPSIVSWESWKEMDSENSESYLREHILILQNHGIVKIINIDYLTSFISGALNELAINISRTNQYDINEIEELIRMMLEGIKKDGEES